MSTCRWDGCGLPLKSSSALRVGDIRAAALNDIEAIGTGATAGTIEECEAGHRWYEPAKAEVANG